MMTIAVFILIFLVFLYKIKNFSSFYTLRIVKRLIFKGKQNTREKSENLSILENGNFGF